MLSLDQGDFRRNVKQVLSGNLSETDKHMREVSGAGVLVEPGLIENADFLDTKREVHRVDFSYRLRVNAAELLVIIQCSGPDARRVRAQDVRNLDKSTQALEAHKGIMVACQGCFETEAIDATDGKNIGLMGIGSTSLSEAMTHYTVGAVSRVEEFLTRRGGATYGELAKAEGVSSTRTSIYDYLASTYGEEVATFLCAEPLIPLSDVLENNFKRRLVDQLRAMGQHWFSKYMIIETCGLNLQPFGYDQYLRSANLRSIYALRELKRQDDIGMH